jgi:hypothetical protein
MEIRTFSLKFWVVVEETYVMQFHIYMF